ncbi:DUF3131 domain-containing protein [Defluviimonas sp. WL0002]|uniref:DUF3131 domain-containing protein n=1 Tax=Albidovulum marisflavi TaxID=2984159 RepID=A0ABT2ZCM9_9RHOB|nr:DUF3131 domain-containing protein [Defluviimonas sp. WL0002]MCV2868879.1 DUF3131 domain-containing protein [Defluviimonas sp. WL0002]
MATPDGLEAVLEPLLVASVPIALVLSPEALGSAGSRGAAALVRHLVTGFPQLVEPVLALPGLSGMSPYFQRRTASEALAGLNALLSDGAADTEAGVTPLAPLTVATAASGQVNFDPLRALGIRQVIDTAANGMVTSTGCASRTICMLGGARLDLVSEADADRWIARTLAKPGWAMIVLDLTGSQGLEPDVLRRRAELIVAAIEGDVQAGHRFVSLPRAQIGWFGSSQPRRIALRLARPDAGDEVAAKAFAEMRNALLSKGVPHSIAGKPWDGASSDDCLALELTDTADARKWVADRPEADPVCAVERAGGNAPPALAAGVDLVLGGRAWPSFDGTGPFRIGETRLLERPGDEDIARLRDAVIVLDDDAYVQAEARERSLAAVESLCCESDTVLSDVPDLAAAIIAPDPLFEVLRDTYRQPPEPPSGPDGLSGEELLADARQAWQFFERYSRVESGLCVATAHEAEGATYLHQELTMWDLASLLAAIMSAHELALITDAEFASRAGRIVAAIPSAQVGEWRLPAAVISAGSASILSNDFNACDTGRLLSVLRELDMHPLTQGIAAEVVGRWHLDAVISDGRVHSVVGGRMVDQSQTHCSHYTARAFRHWGLPLRSPYMVAEDGTVMDRQMRLMQRVAEIGPFGAEPLLLEAVEMPVSEPSSFLADVLLDQQRRTFERTGELLCVSESPLDRAPWFMYQGLSLATPGQPWVVSTVDNAREWQAESFRREVLLVNTKASYLWAAVRPGAFSNKLARHVRERARFDGGGFCPGVFSASGEPMKGYVDVNTNGIMLQAIAYILRGRKPRFD